MGFVVAQWLGVGLATMMSAVRLPVGARNRLWESLGDSRIPRSPSNNDAVSETVCRSHFRAPLISTSVIWYASH